MSQAPNQPFHHDPRTRSQEIVVDTTVGPLHATQWGGGSPAAVFLHSGVTDRRGFAALAEDLAPLSTLAYDRRGFGRTPTAKVDPLSDLQAILGSVDPPVWLVGSSQGGGLALRAALEIGDQLRGLVLLSPAVPGLALGEVDPDTLRLDAASDRAREIGNVETVLDVETHLWLDGPAQPRGRVGGPARELFRTMNRRVIEQELAGHELSQGDVDIWSLLQGVGAARGRGVKLPVVVAAGDYDVPAIAHRSHQLADALPTGHWQALGGTAHLPYLDAPGLVADLISSVVGS